MGSMPDDKKTLGQVLSTSSTSSSPFSTPPFNSNGTLGRVLTFEVPKGPMLRRKPGICSERYEREKAEFEKIPWYERMWIGTGRDARLEPTDALQSAKTFQRACEQMPDEIPKSALDEKLQQLNDHYSGKNPLPPEQSLELKRRTSFLQDVYTPGPRWENSISGAESAWLSEQNLRFGNSLGIALLGPLFGAPGAATRVLGGSEQQVAAANQVGAAAFDMAAAHVGLGGKRPAPEPLPKPGVEVVRGAPLEPGVRPSPGVVVKRPASNFGAPLPSRHSIRSVRQGGLKKGQNTVAEPGIDMKRDVDAINAGQGTRDGNFYTVNGRTYELIRGDHLVPSSGPGFHSLNRGEFDALGIFNKFGDTPQAFGYATNAAGEAGANRALNIWRLGQ
ncbi:hypothetical protein [Variovorax sp. W6]|uniref:hypothetical protein n=1 Tax=Variovorax sp. W6 TaxID=3093895 RepID=UPI003D8052C4